MNELATIGLVAFIFSFLGSIPPGSINLSIVQLSMDGHKSAALRFALAAALVEYPYAYIALRFEKLITGNAWIQTNFSLISAFVMISLGIITWWQHRNPAQKPGKLQTSGFRKGLIISILNPLVIPFWIGIAAYLKLEGIINLSSEVSLHAFVLGVSLGTFLLLSLVAILSSRINERFAQNSWLRYIPTIVFFILGIYSLIRLMT